jgi:hypothetical protein
MATVQEDVPGLAGKPLFARAHGRSGLGPLQRVDFDAGEGAGGLGVDDRIELGSEAKRGRGDVQIGDHDDHRGEASASSIVPPHAARKRSPDIGSHAITKNLHLSTISLASRSSPASTSTIWETEAHLPTSTSAPVQAR